MSIYQNNHIEIQKTKKQFTLVVKDTPINNEVKHFWSKTFDLININKKNINKNTNILFTAHSIETLPSLLKSKNYKLSYRHAKILFINFLLQLTSLEKEGFCIISLDLNDFIIINKDEDRYDAKIIFINLNKVHKLNTDHFFLKKPSDVSKLLSSTFNSPEIESIKDIPVKIHKNTIYYSIGKLITYCINRENELTDEETFRLSLDSIFESKLYYGIMRCIKNNPIERYYLYI
jgi:hypothetical protein